MINALTQLVQIFTDFFTFISNFFKSIFQNALVVAEFNNNFYVFLTDIVYSPTWGSVLGLCLMSVVSACVVRVVINIFKL